jgi:hypothetical protein
MEEDTQLSKEKRLLYKTASGLLGLLSILIIVVIIGGLFGLSYFDKAAKGQNVITVSGEAEVTAIPDITRVWFSVEVEKATVEAAQEEASKKTNDVIAFLEDQDIDKKDIKTTGYNVYPRYEYEKKQIVCITYPCDPIGERVLKGYTVTQSIEVKLRDTDKTGNILAGLGSRGVTNINGPSFEIDDPDALEQEAKEKAIEQAREKAEKLAKALGVRLGDVVSFSEGGGGYPIYYGRGGADMTVAESAAPKALPPEVPIGENTISAYVSVTYEIK